MKMRILLAMCLAVLWVAGTSLSQEQSLQSSSGTAQNPSGGGLQTVIVQVRRYPVVELAELLRSIAPEVGVTSDEKSNRLILTAPAERMKELLNLIQQLDVPNAGTLQTQYLTYRVYMLEIPLKGQDFKSFSLVLERPSRQSSTELLDALKDKDLQIGGLFQGDQRDEEEKGRLVIQGRAASQEVIKRIVEKIPGSQLKQLVWEDETFTSGIPAAQITRLPQPLQEHLRKFLGDEIQTVGYWFGSLSFPSEVRAPIGPWMLELKTRSDPRTNRAGDLVLEIEVQRESDVPFLVPTTRILSNSVQGKVGKPIIIGYNRDSYGTRTMGAVVILPEADTAGPEASGKTAP